MNNVQLFRALHSNPLAPLLLPNVWDAGTARLVESLGAKAIATTSAGVAWSKGYPDGNAIPAPLQATLAGEILRAVKVPVSIDFEAGYSDSPAEVAESLRPILAAGIAGINLEDGNGDPSLLAKKIEAIKALAAKEGADLFLNARTDVYLQDLVPDEQKVEETLRRAALYRNAGADGLFVPGLTEQAEIPKITGGVALPINLMANPALPKAHQLAQLGVRRLSAGIGLSKVIFGQVKRLAGAFLEEGDSRVLPDDGMAFGELQCLFARGA